MDASEKNMTDKEAIVKVLRYGEKLLESNRIHKFACAVAGSLSTRFSWFEMRDDAFRLAEIALPLLETIPGDHMNAWNQEAEYYRSVGNYRSALEALDRVF